MQQAISHKSLLKTALILAVITIIYNVAEGLIAMYFGVKDETLTLFGFGADSFVETVSALGILQMLMRIKKNPNSDRSDFEILALKITGWCFYALVAILTISAIVKVFEGNQPKSTVSGLIIASISILGMWLLIKAKLSVGRKLNSQPMISDAKCNQVCLYMSIVLLVSSGLWHWFKIPYIDILGTLGIVYFCIKEGREAFQKAKGIACCDC